MCYKFVIFLEFFHAVAITIPRPSILCVNVNLSQGEPTRTTSARSKILSFGDASYVGRGTRLLALHTEWPPLFYITIHIPFSSSFSLFSSQHPSPSAGSAPIGENSIEPEGGLCLRLMHHARHYQIQPGSASRLVAAQAASPCKLNTPLNAAPARALISSGDGSEIFLLRLTWLVILQRLVSCSITARMCLTSSCDVYLILTFSSSFPFPFLYILQSASLCSRQKSHVLLLSSRSNPCCRLPSLPLRLCSPQLCTPIAFGPAHHVPIAFVSRSMTTGNFLAR